MTVKTWHDRIMELEDGVIVTTLHVSRYMQAEIDDLRAKSAMDDAMLAGNSALIDSERNARKTAWAELETSKGVIMKAGLALQRAVLDEREACAKVCDVYGASDCAKHIRMRGTS